MRLSGGVQPLVAPTVEPDHGSAATFPQESLVDLMPLHRAIMAKVVGGPDLLERVADSVANDLHIFSASASERV